MFTPVLGPTYATIAASMFSDVHWSLFFNRCAAPAALPARSIIRNLPPLMAALFHNPAPLSSPTVSILFTNQHQWPHPRPLALSSWSLPPDLAPLISALLTFHEQSPTLHQYGGTRTSARPPLPAQLFLVLTPPPGEDDAVGEIVMEEIPMEKSGGLKTASQIPITVDLHWSASQVRVKTRARAHFPSSSPPPSPIVVVYTFRGFCK